MSRFAQLQFQRLPREAQRATLWRLAWSGQSPEQIAERIGWTAEQVRSAMHDEIAPPHPVWGHRPARLAANA
jgi:DNA-directed RNA polymerase specialized sigma24 family protein